MYFNNIAQALTIAMESVFRLVIKLEWIEMQDVGYSVCETGKVKMFFMM